MDVMDHKEYFLFGHDMSSAYYSEGWEDFLVIFKEKKDAWDFQLYIFDWSIETGEDLLSNYDGYGGFARLNEEEYKQLDEIRNG